MCWGTRHVWTWGVTTTTDEMPLSLRCECGALTREQANPIAALSARLAASEARVRELEAAVQRMPMARRSRAH